MDLTEQLVSEMVLEVNNGSYLVVYHPDGADGEAVEIDFKPPWRRISMISGLEDSLGVTFPQDLASEEARLFLAKLVSSNQFQNRASHASAYCMKALSDMAVTRIAGVVLPRLF